MVNSVYNSHEKMLQKQNEYHSTYLSFSSSLMMMAYQIIKLANKELLLQILVFLSATGIQTWQIWGIFIVFIQQHTSDYFCIQRNICLNGSSNFDILSHD